MIASGLNEFIDSSALSAVSFFNGRLLTAETLRRQGESQQARERHALQSVGWGVARGLEVSLVPPEQGQVARKLRVTQGLGVSPVGDMVVSNDDIELNIAPTAEETGATPTRETKAFTGCGAVPYIAPSAGFYLLALRPHAEARGRAPRSGLALDGRVVGCDRDFWKLGLIARLVPVDPGEMALDDAESALWSELARASYEAKEPEDESRVRNLFAHFCFRTAHHRRRLRDPLAELQPPPVARLVRAQGNCDLPVATFRWLDGQGVKSLDQWTVRRPLHGSGDPAAASLHARRVEAEALRQQFQNHFFDLMDSKPEAQRPGIEARRFFRYLPSAGVLRVQSPGLAGTPASPPVLPVPLRTFFDDRPIRHRVVEGRRLDGLLAAAVDVPPLDLDDDPSLALAGSGDEGNMPRQAEVVATYETRESLQGRRASDEFSVVFAGAQVPSLGYGRYDTHRFGFAHYA